MLVKIDCVEKERNVKKVWRDCAITEMFMDLMAPSPVGWARCSWVCDAVKKPL